LYRQCAIRSGHPLQTVYCAAKHALKGLIDGLRVELMERKSNVRTTLVKPSSINTPLFNKAKTYLGVMPRPVPPVYEPELAARALLHAAEHPVRDLYIGGGGKLFTVVERISHRLLDLQQLRSGFAGQKTEWTKSSDAPNNLYQAVEHDGGVRGDFTRETTNRSVYQRVRSGRGRLLRLSLGLFGLCTAAALVERNRTTHYPRTGGRRLARGK
jgi:short subunit dehydrogenase